MMITLSIPSQALQRVFGEETTIDMRDPGPCHQPSTEVAWLLIPIYVAQPGSAKQVAVETPTRLEFAPAHVRQ